MDLSADSRSGGAKGALSAPGIRADGRRNSSSDDESFADNACALPPTKKKTPSAAFSETCTCPGRFFLFSDAPRPTRPCAARVENRLQVTGVGRERPSEQTRFRIERRVCACACRLVTVNIYHSTRAFFTFRYRFVQAGRRCYCCYFRQTNSAYNARIRRVSFRTRRPNNDASRFVD